jgi:hypothetical protein
MVPDNPANLVDHCWLRGYCVCRLAGLLFIVVVKPDICNVEMCSLTIHLGERDVARLLLQARQHSTASLPCCADQCH